MNLSWSHPFFIQKNNNSAGWFWVSRPTFHCQISGHDNTFGHHDSVWRGVPFFRKCVCVCFFCLSFRMEFPKFKKKKSMDGLEILDNFSMVILRTRCLCKFQMRRMESAIATVQRIEDKPKKMPGRRCSFGITAVRENPWKAEAIKCEKKWLRERYMHKESSWGSCSRTWRRSEPDTSSGSNFFPKMHVCSSCKLKWQQKDPQTPSKIIKKLRIFYGPHHHHRELTW